MSIEIQFWQLVGLAITLIGAWWGGAKLFFGQVDRRLNERFKEHEGRLESLKGLLNSHAADEKARLNSIEDDVKDHGERLARLESDIKHAPTHDDIKGIHRRIDRMQEDVGRLPVIERLLHEINSFLMNNK